MSITKYLRENAGAHANAEDLIRACMKDTGNRVTAVRKAWRNITVSKSPVPLGYGMMVEVPKAPHVGLTESDLRKKHDVRYIVKAVAERLQKGVFVPEQDFIRQAGLASQNGYRMALDDSDFAKFKGRAGGVVYWSHPESISKMRAEGILR